MVRREQAGLMKALASYKSGNSKMKHGSKELDMDAEKLLAFGADPGLTLQDIDGALELETIKLRIIRRLHESTMPSKWKFEAAEIVKNTYLSQTEGSKMN